MERLQIQVGPLEFEGEIFYWRGPAPYHYIAAPPEVAAELAAVSPLVTYGWGVIPVTVRIGEATWTTSLFPKDGGYLVPIKDKIRKAEELAVGDVVTVGLTVRS